jgi:hypothetical protein
MDTTSSSKYAAKNVSINNINLSEVLEDMFLILSSKEKEVIVKRFSLNNQPRMTLEKIGQEFSVTRERIRQIEKIALGKLKRTVKNTKLNDVSILAKQLIQTKGGVSTESSLITDILNVIGSSQDLDSHIIRLALNITPDFKKVEKTNIYYPFWRLENIPESYITAIIQAGISILNKKGDVIDSITLAEQIKKQLAQKDIKVSIETIISALQVDKRIKKLKDDTFGLMTWRHINPRSIRDKAYIVLKQVKKPLHFIEIANKIAEFEFDRKVVTTQAVHNELIRYDQFVLVGRGLYALKEWGYKKGTVADVIEDLLSKKSPLSKQEIIKGVLKQRQVKKGTISLNLQKNPHFVRVGRAMYALDKSLKK